MDNTHYAGAAAEARKRRAGQGHQAREGRADAEGQECRTPMSCSGRRRVPSARGGQSTREAPEPPLKLPGPWLRRVLLAQPPRHREGQATRATRASRPPRAHRHGEAQPRFSEPFPRAPRTHRLAAESQVLQRPEGRVPRARTAVSPEANSQPRPVPPPSRPGRMRKAARTGPSRDAKGERERVHQHYSARAANQ